MSSIDERVKKIVAEQLGVKEEEVQTEASFVEDLGADSLDAVELVVQLQVYFGVEIKNIEEGRPALQSINTLAQFVKTRQAVNEAPV